MELETLKTLWQEQETPPLAETSGEELLALLQRRSGGPIARMRRNLRKELLIMVFSYMACILFYLFLFDEGRMGRVSWIFVGALLFFGAYYYRKNQLLKSMQCVSCEVRSNLARQIKTLQRYIRFYFWASIIFIPLMTILSFELALQSRGPELPPYNMRKGLLLVSGLILFLTIFGYFFNRWYIHRLYGRHIRKLQELLDEMDEVREN